MLSCELCPSRECSGRQEEFEDTADRPVRGGYLSLLESASPLRRRTVDGLVVWTAVVLSIAKKVALKSMDQEMS